MVTEKKISAVENPCDPRQKLIDKLPMLSEEEINALDVYVSSLTSLHNPEPCRHPPATSA